MIPAQQAKKKSMQSMQQNIAAWVAQVGIKRQFQRNDGVLRHGDAAQHLWQVVSSWVKLAR